MYERSKVKEVEFDGVTFYIRPMDPFEAVKLMGDLQKVISPIIGKVTEVFYANKKDKDGKEEKKMNIEDLINSDMASANVGAIFNALADNIDGDNLQLFLKRILDSRYIAFKTYEMKDAQKLDTGIISEVFGGNLSGMYRLAWEVLLHNYGDFLSIFSSLSGLVKVQ